jgi:hypothetical protein
MLETFAHIIGLQKDLTDPGSGAAVSFHVVRQYAVNLHGDGSSSATFASYVSREAFAAGKNPLSHVTAQFNAMPTGDSALFPTWFAEKLLAADSVHDLSAATPIYADAPSNGPTEEPAA